MSYELVYEDNGRGVVVTWMGQVSGQEVRAANDYVYSPERLPRLRYQIWDFTNATSTDVSMDDLWGFVVQDQVASQQNPNIVAALIRSKLPSPGLEDIYRIYAQVWVEEMKTEIFDDLATAKSWIADQAEGREARGQPAD